MSIRHLHPDYAVAPQVLPADVARLKEQGFATLVCNRPDGKVTQADCDAFAAVYAAAAKPVLGFCRTGMRAESLWKSGAGVAPASA